VNDQNMKNTGKRSWRERRRGYHSRLFDKKLEGEKNRCEGRERKEKESPRKGRGGGGHLRRTHGGGAGITPIKKVWSVGQRIRASTSMERRKITLLSRGR